MGGSVSDGSRAADQGSRAFPATVRPAGEPGKAKDNFTTPGTSILLINCKSNDSNTTPETPSQVGPKDAGSMGSSSFQDKQTILPSFELGEDGGGHFSEPLHGEKIASKSSALELSPDLRKPAADCDHAGFPEVGRDGDIAEITSEFSYLDRICGRFRAHG